jgi:hypothetical protein
MHGLDNNSRAQTFLVHGRNKCHSHKETEVSKNAKGRRKLAQDLLGRAEIVIQKDGTAYRWNTRRLGYAVLWEPETSNEALKSWPTVADGSCASEARS